MTEEQKRPGSTEQETREALRRQLEALKKRWTQLVEDAGVNADTPLDTIFPAWPSPEEMPDHFDWDTIERELRSVEVARLDPFQLNDLQKRIICATLGMETALIKDEISTQQFDRIGEIVERLLEHLQRRAERPKAAS